MGGNALGKAALHPNLALQGGNQITGHVFNSSRRPVSDINVELLNDYYQMLARTRTNSSGFFVFNNLSPGNFKVHVITSGTDYDEQTQDVSISNFVRQGTAGPVFRGRESRLLDIFLTTRRETTTSLASAPGTVFVQEVPLEARKAYEKALSEFGKNKKDEGVRELKKAIEQFPNYYSALQRLGEEYVSEAEFEAATKVLIKAIEVYPRAHDSLQLLGVAYYNLGQKQSAIDMFDRAISVNPNSINSHVWLGIGLRMVQKYDQAEEHLTRANQLAKGKVASIHWQLALLYKERRRFAAAADELELFLKLQPDSRDAEGIKKVIARLREQAAAPTSR